jgi:hypothetical protein
MDGVRHNACPADLDHSGNPDTVQRVNRRCGRWEQRASPRLSPGMISCVKRASSLYARSCPRPRASASWASPCPISRIRSPASPTSCHFLPTSCNRPPAHAKIALPRSLNFHARRKGRDQLARRLRAGGRAGQGGAQLRERMSASPPKTTGSRTLPRVRVGLEAEEPPQRSPANCTATFRGPALAKTFWYTAHLKQGARMCRCNSRL